MTERTTAFVWALEAPRSIEPLLDALLQAFRDFGEKPARMFVATTDVKHTAYNEARFIEAVRSPATTSVAVKGAGAARVDVDLPLRDRPFDERLLAGHRHVRLVAPLVAPDDQRLLRFLEVTCATYAVAHGGVIRVASYQQAAADAFVMGGNRNGTDEEKRISFDAMNAPEALHKLRRLYPVTIIGPAIWAALPPLPAADPPLAVRDLADCKMITAWPTLVDPHDLSFLLGTRALRHWLWPHTIQNPADDPAAIDTRLRWADLLPW